MPAFADVCVIDVVSDGELRRVAVRRTAEARRRSRAALGRQARRRRGPGRRRGRPWKRFRAARRPSRPRYRGPRPRRARPRRAAHRRSLLGDRRPAGARPRPGTGRPEPRPPRAGRRGYEEDDLDFARVLSGRAGLRARQRGAVHRARDRRGAPQRRAGQPGRGRDGAGPARTPRLRQRRRGGAAELRLGRRAAGHPARPRSSTGTAPSRRTAAAAKLEDLPGRRVLAGPTRAARVHAIDHSDRRAALARRQGDRRAGPRGRPELAVNVVEDITTVKRRRSPSASWRRPASCCPHRWTRRRPSTAWPPSVPQLADWCAVHVADPKGLPLVAVAHSDPDKVRFAWEYEER